MNEEIHILIGEIERRLQRLQYMTRSCPASSMMEVYREAKRMRLEMDYLVESAEVFAKQERVKNEQSTH